MSVLIFGLGYTSSAFMRRIGERYGPVIGTKRGEAYGEVLSFDGVTVGDDLRKAASEAAIILVSTPPGPTGDPVLASLGDVLGRSHALKHVLYLSTIGVYGDWAGAWIDGHAPLRTRSDRGQWRVKAEQQWLFFGSRHGVSMQVFRLGGIYGPGRNPLIDLAIGSARRINKPGQVFNRIHVDDIALVLEAALTQGKAGAIWNVVDNEPAPPQDVIAHAAEIAGVSSPPLLEFEAAEMTPMARSFYSDNRRVSNRSLLRDLKVTLLYPTYREGLAALLAAGEHHPRNVSLRPRDRKAAAGGT
jgi:nucleoside-diphosphate-sugar epimerase